MSRATARRGVRVAALLLLAGCSGASGAEPSTITVAGAIRPSADCSWHLIDDGGHAPAGIESVEGSGGQVVVRFSEPGSQVVTFVATPDETLAAQGYRVGASVGLDEAVVTIAPAPDCDQLGEWANVWVYGLLKR